MIANGIAKHCAQLQKVSYEEMNLMGIGFSLCYVAILLNYQFTDLPVEASSLIVVITQYYP